MNINYSSRSSIRSIGDLNELQIEHKEIYDHFVKNSTCVVNSWWSQFTIFYGQTFKTKRKSYWIILDDLFVPLVFVNGTLSVLILPFGKGTPDEYINVLRKCTSFFKGYNKRRVNNIIVKWINHDQLAFLKKSKQFDSLFSLHEYKVGPEYHFSAQSLIQLSGKEYSYVRRKISKLRNAYKNIIIEEYSDDRHNDIINLNNSWSLAAYQRYGSLFDKDYYSEIIKNHEYLQHIILVAIDNDKIVGMISGEIVNNTGYCLFRKVSEGYDGLSELLVKQLAEKFYSLNTDVKIFNDGGAGKTQGLHFFKERFRPVNKPKRYKLQQNFRVLDFTAYKGPSVVSLIPSARVVVESTSNLLEEIDNDSIAIIKNVITDVLGDDLKITDIQLENKPILMIGQLIIFIQQASRHEVKHYEYHSISRNRHEIIFEVVRSSMLPKLVECIQILYDLITFGDNAQELQRFYDQNRRKFAFTLGEYIANERKQIASRFGINCHNDVGSKVWVGEGKHSKLLTFGYSEKTAAIACHIARDKFISLNYIKQAGAPVPYQVNVKDRKALQKLLPTLSFPVVLKPRHGSKGKGVQLNINSPQELIESYKKNPFANQAMVIQEHVAGHEFRLLVINEQFVAAVKRIPAYVEGDGLHSVVELIEIKNKVERRDGLYLMPIKVDDNLKHVLIRQNLTLDSVLKQNQRVQVREVSNVSLGGITEDCTDLVHPDNKAAAVIAAKSCLLDVAGIDFVSNDISRSWREGSGKIIEINNKPGIDLHMLPTRGKKREITKYFLEPFLNASNMGSIPKIVVTGYKRKNRIAEKCFSLLNKIGYVAGLQLDNKVKTLHNEALLAGSFIERSHQFLCNQDLDAAVMVWKLSDLIASGSPCHSVACTVITDELIDPNVLKRSHDDLIHHRVYKLLANISSHSVVIDFENESLYQILTETIPKKNLVLVSFDANKFSDPGLQEHIRHKGRVLSVVVNESSGKKALLWADGLNPQIVFNDLKPSQNLLFSLAAILTVGKNIEEIKRVITLPSYQRFSFKSHALIKLDRLNAYVCDPRDTYALKTFKNWSVSKRECIWLIVTSDAGSSKDWQKWIKLFQSKNLHIIFIKHNPDSTYDNSTSLPDVETAIEFIYNYSDLNDIVVFLEIGSSVKDKVSLKPEKNDSLYVGDLFSPLNLMQLFQGQWLNGNYETGYINRVSLNPFTAMDNDMVIIPEYTDTSESLTMVENTFKQNCSVVVTPIIPDNIPKWRPVLLAANPFWGLMRLSRITRSRTEGVVFGIISNESTYNDLNALQQKNNNNSDLNYYAESLGSKGFVEFESLLVAIINSQKEDSKNFSFFFLPGIDIMSLRILKPNVVFIDTLVHNFRPKEIFYKLDELCTAYLLVRKNEENQWRSEVQSLGLRNTVLVPVDSKSSAFAMDKLINNVVKNRVLDKPQELVD